MPKTTILALTLAALVTATATPAMAVEPAPHVTISVRSKPRLIKVGGDIAYQVKVHNHEAGDLDATVTAALPAGMSFTRADNEGRPAEDNKVIWDVKLSGKEAKSLTLGTHLDSVAPGAKAVAMRFCVVLPGQTDDPLVCATDLDRVSAT